MSASVRDLIVDIAVRRRGTETVRVLDGVDLDVPGGRVTALVGESGCGKSLVAAALSGLLPPGSRVSGRIVLDGTDIRHDDEPAWRLLSSSAHAATSQSSSSSAPV